MRLARVLGPDGPRPAVWDDGDWWAVSDLFADEPQRTGERLGATRPLLSPVEPAVVLGMAHNSGAADRQIPPQAFMKSARTVVGPGEPIVIDPEAGAVQAEGELTLVVKRTCRDVTPETFRDVVLGWTIANDVTNVDQVPLDSLFTQAKNGDGYTPLGPWIETDLVLDDLDIAVSGQQHQARGSTAGLAWSAVEAFCYVTRHVTLGPGDVLLTGCPATSVPIRAGDDVSITIGSVGPLRNPVTARSVATTT